MKTDLMVGEEFLVPSLEDIHLWVVEFRIIVQSTVPLPDKATHPGAAFWWELAVKDDDDAFLRTERDDGGLEKEVLHLLLFVQVQRSL